MNKKKIHMCILVGMITCSFLITSCSMDIFDGINGDTPTTADAKLSNEIEEVVETFLESVQSGEFADNDYVSELVTDDSLEGFADFEEFSRDDINDVLEDMTFELGDVQVTTVDETGICEITMETENIVDYIQGTSEPQTIALEFELEYDDGVWTISDLGQLPDYWSYNDVVTLHNEMINELTDDIDDILSENAS